MHAPSAPSIHIQPLLVQQLETQPSKASLPAPPLKGGCQQENHHRAPGLSTEILGTGITIRQHNSNTAADLAQLTHGCSSWQQTPCGKGCLSSGQTRSNCLGSHGTAAWPPTCIHTGGSCWWLTAGMERGFLSAWSYTEQEPSILLQDQV